MRRWIPRNLIVATRRGACSYMRATGYGETAQWAKCTCASAGIKTYHLHTRTAVDCSGKIIRTKKQGGRVGRLCSAEPGTRRKPPESTPSLESRRKWREGDDDERH